jgi:23S rRNA (adenine2030-N6)-methyltransferase
MMLSYRHAFHAGNPADVLKHCVLIHCLDYLRRKEKPFLAVDTHAGAGLYFLEAQVQPSGDKDRAALAKYRTAGCEWENGVGRLLDAAGVPKAAAARLPLVSRFLEVAGMSPNGKAGGTVGGGALRYPGSPAIIRSLLREQDRAVCFELHPADFGLLSEEFGRVKEGVCAGEDRGRRIMTRREDGLAGLKALLPPPERRGCIFIDPSYELREDYDAIKTALPGALRRFAAGLYIIWYPLLAGTDKPRKPGGEFAADLLSLSRENLSRPSPRCRPSSRCRVELRTGPVPERGMYGSGLVIFNPPWTLKAALEESMDGLAALLSNGRKDWEMEWSEE